MKNYMDAVRAAGIGRTPQLCQDALIETLEELFAGKKYNGQQSRKELKIFKQRTMTRMWTRTRRRPRTSLCA